MGGHWTKERREEVFWSYDVANAHVPKEPTTEQEAIHKEVVDALGDALDEIQLLECELDNLRRR
jgi:hypothetical protein